MDNNKQSLAADATDPIVPPQAAQTTPLPPTTPPVPETGSEQSSPSSKKMIIMLIVGVFVVLAVVGGIYMLLNKQPALEPQVQQTTSAPKPPSLAQVKDALDKELDSINVSASEGDFKSVDQDLQSLQAIPVVY